MGVQMERMGGNLCALDGRVGNHEHVMRHCWFSPLVFDAVRRAFGLVITDSRQVEPNRILREEPLLSLTIAQGWCCGRG